VTSLAPGTIDEVSEVLKNANSVRFAGGGTKLGWGEPIDPPDIELSTKQLSEIVEHNAGDLTAIVDAGVSVERAQQKFGEAGQMLALDPPIDGGATIGGIAATGDSGPLRHRYGAIRDLVVGATLVLADGTVARSGGKVIKNVAGYDLAKLFCGSFGTLGLIARVAVRLHPLAPRTLTLAARANDPGMLQDAALTLAHLPLEMDSLDVRYADGAGETLARFGGADPEGRLEVAARALRNSGIELDTIANDAELWDRQRRSQRNQTGATVKVSTVAAAAARVIGSADRIGASVVGRAGMGLFWISLDGDDSELVAAIDELRGSLTEWHAVVLDAPESVRRKVDVWGRDDDGAVGVMKRLKRRFDPHRKCNPGLFVGTI
jgi:glycolate dehydrogenase FAD-binding subunit